MSGWFEEQLRDRIHSDEKMFSDALYELSEPLMGKRASEGSDTALKEIAEHFGIDISPDEIMNTLMHRKVKLRNGWYKNAMGVYLGKTKQGNYVALIPNGYSYCYHDYASGKKVRINSSTQHNIEPEAECFYRPFPARKMNVWDLVAYAAHSVSIHDFIYIAAITLISVLIAMIPPYLTRIIYSDVIHSDKIQVLSSIMAFMISAAISVVLLQSGKELAVSRIEMKTDTSIRAAVMMRLINLPVDFYSNYSSGELSYRATCVNMLCSFTVRVLFSVGLTALMSFMYLFQIFSFSHALVVPALLIMMSLVIFSLVAAAIQSGILKRSMNVQSKEQGIIFAFINGIQKIKLAGAERRAFSKWASIYKEDAELTYNPPLFLKLMSAIQPSIGLIGSLVIYVSAYNASVSVENYMAFMVTYGMISVAFMELCGCIMSIASIKPILDLIEPILEAEPEDTDSKKPVHLRGGIEVSNLSFRYSEKSPLILKDISFKIRPGEYVAIVGRSGCGKSTLMRLLLGFETANNGVIYYDGNNIKKINMKSLRKNIGCVMQNSSLFPGDIYSNITITAPALNEDEAWEAAETAGIAEDIRRMPMKMHTMISEGAGTLSGGQIQRIIIARAVAPKPKILLFDEATSALDNITQKNVSDSLEKLKCTRLVIAHRLSTVKNCKRILVIDGGCIAEEGSYDELIERKGLFSQLVERQRLGEEF